jgi:hypothetical protein
VKDFLAGPSLPLASVKTDDGAQSSADDLAPSQALADSAAGQSARPALQPSWNWSWAKIPSWASGQGAGLRLPQQRRLALGGNYTVITAGHCRITSDYW